MNVRLPNVQSLKMRLPIFALLLCALLLCLGMTLGASRPAQAQQRELSLEAAYPLPIGDTYLSTFERHVLEELTKHLRNSLMYHDVSEGRDRASLFEDRAADLVREVYPDARLLDAEGRTVVPGFIDAHSHAGGGLTDDTLSAAEPLLAQGITTVVINPDGGGAVDLAEQRTELLEHGLGVNAAPLVPHGSIRREVMGMADRAPTAEELDRMRQMVRQGMDEGGFGLSSGPFYAPGSYAETDEFIALSEVAAEYGGVYQSHIRDESNYTIGLIAAVDEVITIAREAGLPGIVTHIKALGPPVWGFSDAVATRIERARAEGVEVFADQYPYDASATSLTAALVPRWAEAGGRDSLVARIQDPAARERFEARELGSEIEEAIGELRPDYRTAILLRHVEGRAYDEIAEIMEVPLGTVKTYIHRARKELQDRLSHLRDDREGAGA